MGVPPLRDHYSSHSWPPMSLLHGLTVSAALLLIACHLAAAAPNADWTTFENCQLVPNEANDGDSFHVRAKDKEYIFRLYYVDAPEIEAVNPSRLIEQAKYFGITVPQVIEVGEAAKLFVQQKLSEPFTVVTRMASAMGRSRKERFYAFVETKEGDLGELLVENGLARAFGTGAQPPGVANSKAEWDKLEQLENAAKQQKIGGWGETSGRLNVRVDKTKQPNGSLPISNFALALPRSTAPSLSGNVSGSTPVTAVGEAVPGSRSFESREAQGELKVNANKLDVNKATEEQLEQVPGIGRGLADRIIAARPFKSADDLRSVKGIGNGVRYEKIRPYFN
jgi:DNA uptake protein ComE-like DNA-binding protein